MSDRPDQLPKSSKLRQLMQALQIDSFKQLCDRAQISSHALTKLRRGEVTSLRYAQIDRLAQALQIPVTELVAIFGILNAEQSTSSANNIGDATAGSRTTVQNTAIAPNSENDQDSQTQSLQLEQLNQIIAELKAEYLHLQTQLEQQAVDLRSQFEQEIIQKLESFMLQWPTAAYAAQQNEKLPARNLVPLLRPVENLLISWGIEAIAQVGAAVEFDPRWHQSISGGAIE